MEAVWQLIEEAHNRYFQFKWYNNIALYTTRHSDQMILEKFNPRFLRQLHSDIIIDLDYNEGDSGDGLMTGQYALALGIKVADCLPVYIFSKNKIGIIHCGWRGVIKGIAKKAVQYLDKYQYALGASIGPCCYEIKEDVADLFARKYPAAVILKDNKYYLDLKSAVISDLGYHNMVGSLNYCTKCHPEYFYSHRQGDNLRRNHAVVLML